MSAYIHFEIYTYDVWMSEGKGTNLAISIASRILMKRDKDKTHLICILNRSRIDSEFYKSKIPTDSVYIRSLYYLMSLNIFLIYNIY